MVAAAAIRLVVRPSRSLATASRSTFTATSYTSRRTMFATRAWNKEPPTQSEEAVKHDNHSLDPKTLQEQTASKAKEEFKQENHNPTASEEASKADMDKHDPLPDHKKKSSGGH